MIDRLAIPRLRPLPDAGRLWLGRGGVAAMLLTALSAALMLAGGQ